jgi:tetratricopeptide (TPR) repeat protein
MRVTLTILALAFSLFGHSQNKVELERLGSAGKLNLVPMYGSEVITKETKYFTADLTFIETVKEKYTDTEAAKELVLLGFNYFYEGQLQTAMKRFNQAWLIDSTNAGIYFGFWIVQTSTQTKEIRNWFFGQNINQVNDSFTAEEYYELGKSLDSDNFYEKIALDYGCSSLGDYKQANIGKESCLIRLQFNSNDTIALQNLANFYLESGQLNDALRIQNQNLENRKAKGPVYNDIAWIFQEMNQLDSAETYYLKAMENSDISYFKARINYCVLMEKKGECNSAIPVIDKCIKALPTEGFFHYTKGKLLLCSGQQDEAIKSLKIAKKLGNEESKALLKEIKK